MKKTSYIREERTIYAPCFNRQKLSVEQIRMIQQQTRFCTKQQLEYWLQSVCPAEYSIRDETEVPADWVFAIFLDYQIDKIENTIKKQLSEW